MGCGLANGKNSFLRKKWLNGFDLILAYLFPGTIRRLTYLAVFVRTVFPFKIGIAVSSRQAAATQQTWQTLAGKMDAWRHREVADRLAFKWPIRRPGAT